VASMRSVLFTMLLLVFILYVFAILIRQLSDDTNMGKQLFPTVWLSMGTLIIEGTLLDNPAETMELILEENRLCAFAFLMVIFLAALTVMNMLVGVLCEVVSAVAKAEKEEMAVSFVRSNINALLAETGLDEDEDQQIRVEDFERLLDSPAAIKALGEVGVDVEGLVDYAEIIFQSDANGKRFDRSLDFDEFMDLVLQLRGTNTATLKDLSDLRKFIQSQNNNRNRSFANLELRVENLQAFVSEMSGTQSRMEDDVNWLLQALLPLAVPDFHSTRAVEDLVNARRREVPPETDAPVIA